MEIRRIFAGAGLTALAAFTVYGQAPAAPRSFEVASIKPAAPQGNMIMMGMKIDGARVAISNFTLQDCIRQAYKIKDYQLTGPDWLGGQRFDINAKLPEGADKDQIPEMLQALLAERFKLQIHREKKELPTYALVVAKGGPKLQKSDDNDTTPVGGPGGPPMPPPPPSPTAGGGGVGHNVNVAFASGSASGGAQGPRSTMMMSGNGHMEAKQMTIANLADFLSRNLDRPVFDETGIQGRYDVSLDFAPGENQMMRRLPAQGMSMEHSSPAESAADPGQSIFTSIQKLGLKLEPRKAPVETIVIDHVEKTPTDN